LKLPLYQVDAFASRPFAGNPAAVCPLEAWIDDRLMQQIAAENALSETAFLVGGDGRYAIRWFTPAVEVDLCGHATLAAAYVVFRFLEPGRASVTFDSKSGALGVTGDGERLRLDFPARPPRRVPEPAGLAAALGAVPLETWAARDTMAVFQEEDAVRALKPDMTALAALPGFAVIVTAAGRDCDFVSRFFAPAKGVPEDPVTGSAHCTLVPFWAERLGRTTLFARQVSARGGELHCDLSGDRVGMAGRAALYLTGQIHL
jgi:PhzF family phenazine biosynthesis protein